MLESWCRPASQAADRSAYAPLELVSPETRDMLAQCAPQKTPSRQGKRVPTQERGAWPPERTPDLPAEEAAELGKCGLGIDPWQGWKNFRGVVECSLFLFVIVFGTASIWWGASSDHHSDEGPRRWSAFEHSGAGVDQRCHGRSPGRRLEDVAIHPRVRSLEACRDICVDQPACKGIEYGQNGSCGIWKGAISHKQPAEGVKCLRKIAPGCCDSETARCKACHLGQSEADFCLEPGHFGTAGCADFCGFVDANYSYPGGDLYHVNSTADGKACCKLCRAERNCTSWTWAPDSVCYLKDQSKLNRRLRAGWVSGLPGRDAAAYQVKSRHGMCVGTLGGLHVERCGGAAEGAQHWAYGRETGQLIAADGRCLQAPALPWTTKKAPLRRCSAAERGQRWELDTFTGAVRARGRGLCLDAPEGNASGGGVFVRGCRSGARGQQWSLYSVAKLRDPGTAGAMRRESLLDSRNSLLCLSVVAPSEPDEPRLVRLQAEEAMGVFACDEARVYSNVSLGIPGVDNEVLDIQLFCPLVGKMRWNTPVFMQLWKAVTDGGRFRFHDWTVKADPDTVFIPERLRGLLESIDLDSAEADNGVFLTNCDAVMRGPLEVVSRRALEVYGAGSGTCNWHPQEDRYLEQCLVDLGVMRTDLRGVLDDRYCSERLHRPSCDTSHSAFHPFKSRDGYRDCWRSASAASDR